jgi:hypothetical protein
LAKTKTVGEKIFEKIFGIKFSRKFYFLSWTRVSKKQKIRKFPLEIFFPLGNFLPLGFSTKILEKPPYIYGVFSDYGFFRHGLPKATRVLPQIFVEDKTYKSFHVKIYYGINLKFFISS